jgi:3-hydroxyisobutyryl-CoA hydrolase
LIQKLIIRPDFNRGAYKVTHRSKEVGAEFDWWPATFDDMDERAIVHNFFSIVPTRQPVCDIAGSDVPDFTEYPYRQYMLPSERDIKGILDASDERHASGVNGLDFILNHYDGKHGVREKVLEVMARKTKTVNGALEWVD